MVTFDDGVETYSIDYEVSRLPDAVVGEAYSFQLSNPKDFQPPFTWLYMGEEEGYPFPEGLTLSTGGLISGTPTKCDTYQLDLLAMDASGWESWVSLTLQVVAPSFAVLGASDLEWTTDGDRAWRVVPAVDDTTLGYAQSGDIDVGEESLLETTITGPGTLTFEWKVSCNRRGHSYSVLVDDESFATIKGEVDWTAMEVPIGDGEHTVTWIYSKGSTPTAGDDAASLRNVRWIPLSIGDAVEAPELPWETSGAMPWTAQLAVNSDGEDAVKSGAVYGAEESVVSAVVNGQGTLSWNWKITKVDRIQRTAMAKIRGGSGQLANSGIQGAAVVVYGQSGGSATGFAECPGMLTFSNPNYIGTISESGLVTVHIDGDRVDHMIVSYVCDYTLSPYELGVDVFVDGVFSAYLENESDWSAESVDIVGEGDHLVEFVYWNAGWYASVGCAYLDRVVWTPQGTDAMWMVDATVHGQGTVSGGGEFANGAECLLQAVPGTGYVFSHWEGDVPDSGEETLAFTVEKDVNVAAVFISRSVAERLGEEYGSGGGSGGGERYYTVEQIHGLSPASLTIDVDPATDSAKIGVTLMRTPTLENPDWTSVVLTDEDVEVQEDGTLQLSIEADGDAAFFRVLEHE